MELCGICGVHLESMGECKVHVKLEGMINERWFKEMAHLLMTMNKPLKLLASMNEQES